MEDVLLTFGAICFYPSAICDSASSRTEKETGFSSNQDLKAF